jgi:hypothetical protein
MLGFYHEMQCGMGSLCMAFGVKSPKSISRLVAWYVA